jgi:hypothetical protein
VSRSTIVADNRLWTVSSLEPRARGRLFQAVVVSQLVDDATGVPVTGTVRVTGDLDGLVPRVAGSGFAGLAGIPARVFPSLDTTAYPLDLELVADGYETRHERVTYAAQPTFPATFAPAELGVRRMRRVPSVLTVSSYDLDAANRPQPLGGAAVRVNGWWAGVDQLGSPASAVALLGVSPGLSAPRAAANLDLPALGSPAEPARTLVQGAPAGVTRIDVDTVGALVVGNLVGLDLADPDRAERVEVVAIDGPADPLSPATVTLRHPLRVAHVAAGPVVRLVPPGLGAPVATMTAASFEGDRTVRVSSLAGLPAGQVVRISGGGSPPEYRITARYELVTNADGVGRFPPLSGAAAVVVAATAGALGATTRLSLTRPTAALDLTLT